MKTKLEKVLLAACIILVLLNGALMFMILIPDFEMEAKHIYINIVKKELLSAILFPVIYLILYRTE